MSILDRLLPEHLPAESTKRVIRFVLPQGSNVEWLLPDQPADLDIIRKEPDTLIALKPFAGTFTIGARRTDGTVEWCKVTVSNPSWLPDLSWLTKWLPTRASAATAAAGGVSGILVSLLIAWLLGGFTPTPAPGPGPGPNPPPPPVPPTPVTEAVDFVVAVTDSENPTVQIAAILGDESLGGWLVDNKIQFRIVDCHSQEYQSERYSKDVATSGVVPPLAMKYAKGKLLGVTSATKVPSVDAVKAWIQGKTLEDPAITWDAASQSLVYHEGGEKRQLTRLAPDKAMLVRLKDIPRFADVKYLVPRDQWREVSHRKTFAGADWILDQDGIGECVGCGASGALRRARYLAGMTDHKLSPGYLYSQINGGRDNGAVIGDSLTVLEKHGTCLYSSVGIKPIYTRQMPSGAAAEAQRFRIDLAYTVPTFDEMVSAIQLGYVIVYGMQVGSNFERFSSEGVAGFASGPGNHCMMADGCHKLSSGEWVVDNVNSWGYSWGPFKNGRCYLSQQHLSRAQNGDAYAIKGATLDPQETNKPKADPPAVKAPVLTPTFPAATTYTTPATTIYGSNCVNGVCYPPGTTIRRR